MSLLLYPPPRPRRDRPYGGHVLPLHGHRGTACAGMRPAEARAPKDPRPTDNRPPRGPKQPSPPNPKDPDKLPDPKDQS